MRLHVLLGWCCLVPLVLASDYYQLLGVERDADDRTIRRAFKKLAISKHPDKDPDNPNAHEDFIKINRAYEVLKDPELRRKYDQFGEKGLKDDDQGQGKQYQSWEFYNDKFGIYDDDPEIVTLSRSDFQQQVADSGDFWFVNFYSTFCGHCHELAPTWREFARKFHGVIRVGAVNCAEDPMLCQGQNVRAYPSLVVYPAGVFFQGHRTLHALESFLVDQLRVELHQLTNRNLLSITQEWQPYANRPWLVDFCDDQDRCLDKTDRKLLAHRLNGVVNIATVTCHGDSTDRLCEKLRTNGLAFYPKGKVEREHEKVISGFDIGEIYQEVIDALDQLATLSEDEYRELLDNVEDPKDVDSLIIFSSSINSANFKAGEYKKLPYLVDGVRVRVAECDQLVDGCEGLHLGSLPKTVFFRKSGHFLTSYGRKDTLHDVIGFVKNAQRSSMISLTENLFDQIQAQQSQANPQQLWIVDFFAPWCHPCMLSLVELSHLPAEFENLPLNVGILDCDIYKRLCQEHGVNSYPTSFLLYGPTASRLVGFQQQQNIFEFIQEALHPSVTELTPETFHQFVENKQENEIWVVDFFAPWCGPCQQLAPEYKKAARLMQDDHDEVSFGSVDCDAHRDLCVQNGIRSYPTIRAYGMSDRAIFDYPPNWWRDHRSILRWLDQFLPSVVEELDAAKFDAVMNEDIKIPWVLDFWAPWCSHCLQFAPTFEQAARLLEGQVKFGKVNCVDHPNLCAQAAVNAYPTIKLYSQGRRNPSSGIRLHAQDANHMADLVQRVLGQHGWQHPYRDEL